MAKQGKDKQAPGGDGVEQLPDGQGELPPGEGGEDGGQADTGAGEIESTGAELAAPVIASAKPAPSGKVRALVLRACCFGEPGEIAMLNEVEAATGAEQGALDLSPAATGPTQV